MIELSKLPARQKGLLPILVLSGLALTSVFASERKDISDLKRSASQDDVAAQRDLGEELFLGDTTEQEKVEGYRWLLAAALDGDAQAMNSLGLTHAEGRNVKADIGVAVDWLQKAAEAGLAEAHYNLGFLVVSGKATPEETERTALEAYESAAEMGHLPSQVQLFRLYRKGIHGAPLDQDAAERWLESALAGGSAEARAMLAERYLEQGEYEAAETLFREAVKEDASLASVQLAVTLIRRYRENGADVSSTEVINHLERGHEQGHPDAARILGQFYYYGEQVDRDFVAASDWLARAALAGDAQAMAMLGLIYSKGETGVVDERLGTYWFGRAAELGHAAGQYNYAQSLLRGRGIEQDREQGIYWLEQAANGGSTNASGLLRELRRQESDQ